jgi:serine/threonine protein kinase/tetratricopeptide (TPR) repeat protein
MRPVNLRSVLKKLSGDEAVDWNAVESSADDSARGLLRELHVIANISAAHQRAADADATASRVVPFSRSDETLHHGLTHWGRLVLRERLAHGADGEVYRAFDTRLQREVALKLVHQDHNEPQVARFLNEARLLARVRHANVVTVFGADVIDGTPGIWMELIAGVTLQGLVSRQGPFGAQEAALIGAELCRALAAIHQAGILHRDIKAQNVMREAGGRIVLMDFSVSAAESTAGGVAGTPVYLAPELFAGKSASPQSDLHSIGVLLFYLVTGTYPIAGTSVAQIAQAHEQGLRKRLRDARADLPTTFVATVERAMSADPAARPGSAGELEDLLMQSLPGPAIGTGSEPVLTRLRWPLLVAAALAVILTGIAITRWSGSFEPTPSPVAFESRPWVLIAAFDNRTTNRELDGVLESAVERELIGSAQFRLASRARVDDVLRLMRRPVETILDAAVAREVSLRDGGIRTLVSGRIEQVGPSTILSASIIDVHSGDSINSIAEEAAGITELPAAIRRLSNRLRIALGDTAAPVQNSSESLQRVTTPSLKALRFYTSAYAAADRNQWPAALSLAQEAVREDPSFAAAHTWLAWAMMRNRYPRQQYLAAAATGMQLSGTASEWERLWINASHAGLSGDTDRELAALDALLRVYPDHFWGVNNLVGLHSRAGRDAVAVRPALRLIELRPRDYNSLYVVMDLYMRLGRLDEAAKYAARIKTSDGFNQYPSGDAWLVDAFVHWHKGAAAAGIQELTRVEAAAQSLTPELRDAVLTRASLQWLSFGRPADAQAALATVVPDARRHLAEATLAYALDQPAVATRKVVDARLATLPAEHSDAVHYTQWTIGMWILARTESREAKKMFKLLEPIALTRRPPFGTAIVEVLAGELALAEGDVDGAIRRLAADRSTLITPQTTFRNAETLADAYVRKADFAAAIHTLEAVAGKKHLSLAAPYWWMRCQVYLGELYQGTGRKEEALNIARELDRTLSEAEPGFALAERVRKLTSAAR